MQQLAWPIVIVVVAVGLLWVFQRRLIYFPDRSLPTVQGLLPGWSAETATTEDGLEIGVWYHPPLPGAATVVVFNGNAGNRSHRVPLGQELTASGLGVVLFDYRGFGDSQGSPSEDGLALDARAAVAYATQRAPASPLVFFGESLGAAVAIEVATEVAPVALILRSPFTSLADVASTHYPWLPVRLLLRDRYPSDERIGAIEAPVLVIAGSDDEIVPAAQSRRIHELAAEPKRLVVIDGARHNDHALLAGRELIDAVLEFVETHA